MVAATTRSALQGGSGCTGDPGHSATAVHVRLTPTLPQRVLIASPTVGIRPLVLVGAYPAEPLILYMDKSQAPVERCISVSQNVLGGQSTGGGKESRRQGVVGERKPGDHPIEAPLWLLADPEVPAQ